MKFNFQQIRTFNDFVVGKELNFIQEKNKTERLEKGMMLHDKLFSFKYEPGKPGADRYI